MISDLPLYISITFLACTAFSYLLFVLASSGNKVFKNGAILWLILTGVLALFGFFMNTDTVPPRMPLLLAPMVLLMIILFNTTKGKTFIDGLDIRLLTWLSIVRIPVEICLYWLFIHKAIPKIMTFEGSNFDILAGISAPLIAYLYFNKKAISKRVFLVWNVIGIVLLCTIIGIAILSVPSPIQQFGFEQPNLGILQFPFVWLASFVAPMVLFSHFVIIRKLLKD